MVLKRVFTLFLCAIMVVYIFIGPSLLERMKTAYEKSLEPVYEKNGWTGVITLWDYPQTDIRGGAHFSRLKGKIRGYEKKNPGIYIELRELNRTEGPSFLRAAAKIGANPDIAPVGSDHFCMSGGYLEELDGFISFGNRSDFTDRALDAVTYKGRIYGMPWAMTGYTMLLNTDIFSEKNIDIPGEAGWTYEQFAEILKKLTYDTNGRGGPDVFGLSAPIEPGCYAVFGILMSDGGQIIDEETGKYVFNTPEALSGLIKLCDLKHKYKGTHPNFGSAEKTQALSAFLKGEAAVYIGETWTVPLLRNSQGGSGISFAPAMFPRGKSDIPLSMGLTVRSYAVFKQKDEEKRKACMDFIEYITSSESQDNLVDFGYFPVRKSGGYLYENDKEMYTIQQNLHFAEPPPKVDNWSEIDLILQTKIKEAIEGSISPEKALKDAEQSILGLYSRSIE